MAQARYKKTQKSRKTRGVVNFSTTINKELKELLERYCKSKGLRINHIVEEALINRLEDEIDTQSIHARANEELIDWSGNK